MSGRIKIVRVLSNPSRRKTKKRKGRHTAKVKRPRRRTAKRSTPKSGTKFLVQAMKGNRIYYLNGAGYPTPERRSAARYASAKTAEAHMRKNANFYRKRGCRLLQIVAE